ncbi:MAG: DUF1622 domain-containing protein [Vitreimonas sp.]
MFREWFFRATEYLVLFIDAIALFIVIIAVVEAAIGAVRLMLSRGDPHLRRDIWLRFARWLVAALTFQLAADIIETSITDDWMSLGRIAVVALIRTVLNYFLERDLKETREEQRASEERAAEAARVERA